VRPARLDGYLDDPDLTARSFTSEWFRTGDLGHVDEDGYVFITAACGTDQSRRREDLPVEIDQIEALPGVREAGTFGVPHPTLGEELVAAVVLEPDATLGTAEILAHVRDRLGPRQVPRHVYVVDALPRTDAGKLRRRALPEWVGIDADRPAPASERLTDATPLESALTGLWSAVLRRDDVGRDDNFFLLGGDSMSAAELVHQVAAVFGVSLPLHAMFEGAATPVGMARAIAIARPSAAGEPLQALDVDRERNDGIVRAQPRALRDAALLQVRARPRERQDAQRAA
jgi:acyl carrier protein